MKTTNENKVEKTVENNEQNLELNDTQLEEVAGGNFEDRFKKPGNNNGNDINDGILDPEAMFN